MKSFWTKTVPVLFAFSSVAVAAAVISKEEVNKKVAAIVAPYNTADTTMSIRFTDLHIDAVRTLDFGLEASVTKKSDINTLDLKLQDIQYHYANGKPTASGDLSLRLDLVKAFGQETLNEFGTQLDSLAQEMVKEYGKKYGQAAVVKASVEDVKKDAAGNLQSVRFRADVTMDFSKLPADLKPEEVEITAMQMDLTASAQGLGGRFQVALNPHYKGFDADQEGLKEFIEKLLADDKDTYDSLSQTAGLLNSVAEWLVNQQPEKP